MPGPLDLDSMLTLAHPDHYKCVCSLSVLVLRLLFRMRPEKLFLCSLTITLLPGNFVAENEGSMHTFMGSEQIALTTKHATTTFLLHSRGMQFTRISVAQASLCAAVH